MGNTGKKPSRTVAHPDTTSASSAPELPAGLLKQWRQHTKNNRTKTASDQKTAKESQDQKNVDQADSEPKNEQAAAVAAVELAEEDQAVDDIMKQESDELLAQQDAQNTPAEVPAPKRYRLRRFFAILFWLVVAALIVAMVYPSSRYFVLNTVGVRSKASVVVFDNQTRLPLKNVSVSIGQKQVKTDSKGQAVLTELKLGSQDLTIKRVAYEQIHQPVTIGWGSNPLGEYLLKATGVQYTINTHDFISGKKVEGIEARSGEAVATADNQGVITLTLDQAETDTIPLQVTAEGYRTEELDFPADQDTPIEVTMVPQAKTVFAAKQNGRYDIIAMDIDGKHREVILAGTGSEGNNTSIVPSFDGTQVAVVSHRDDLRGAQGQAVSTLSIVTVADKTVRVAARAERIQLVDWIGTKLIYQESNTTGTADDPERYKLMSYDAVTSKPIRLAATNQFNVVESLKGQIYYAPSSADKKDVSVFYRINADGSGLHTVLGQEVWSAVRTGYSTLSLQTPNGWYTYTAAGSPEQSVAPSSFTSRQYVEGPNQQSIWVEAQNNTGKLSLHDNLANKDQTVASASGLTYPVRWLGANSFVVRVVTGSSVADYAASTQSTTLKKITDVANTYGTGH